MSLATHTALAGDFDDRGLSAFLATVPAAAEYDLAELDNEPRIQHRPHRSADKRAAIDESWREWK